MARLTRRKANDLRSTPNISFVLEPQYALEVTAVIRIPRIARCSFYQDLGSVYRSGFAADALLYFGYLIWFAWLITHTGFGCFVNAEVTSCSAY